MKISFEIEKQNDIQCKLRIIDHDQHNSAAVVVDGTFQRTDAFDILSYYADQFKLKALIVMRPGGAA